MRLAITERTKAVMVVHLYGHPCDMDSIREICDEKSLLLVEDCAEGFGTKWKNSHVGTFGDVATFSFFGNKTITTGEGGMVLARNPQVMGKCRHLKSQGTSPTREYWHDALAYNYRMTNIQAAIGLSQIEMADEILSLKARTAASYASKLAGLPLRMHTPVGDVKHSYWMCSIVLDNSEHREPLRQHLRENGVDTRPFFPPAHRTPHSASTGSYPVADSLSARGLNLPSFPHITDVEISFVCDLVRSYFSNHSNHI
ncbi:aminotransferase, DegT/DnrJ/EryC1/StrS family [Brucella ovis ATCC 25840]|uniref:Aminotransferase, DegT/DnrJ/EryC1/StrS family n=1 Tax=Brucella ovis (strain ATCC 25840 / 63/290 / NCTC 10512) TaxID=444178 RepID=A0A0H3AR23_BRUO2|nr:aminotransferase, DegT/DnrJ/EryC1/StrS family [Brucella ovis ATCC 25840]